MGHIKAGTWMGLQAQRFQVPQKGKSTLSPAALQNPVSAAPCASCGGWFEMPHGVMSGHTPPAPCPPQSPVPSAICGLCMGLLVLALSSAQGEDTPLSRASDPRTVVGSSWLSMARALGSLWSKPSLYTRALLSPQWQQQSPICSTSKAPSSMAINTHDKVGDYYSLFKDG